MGMRGTLFLNFYANEENSHSHDTEKKWEKRGKKKKEKTGQRVNDVRRLNNKRKQNQEQ